MNYKFRDLTSDEIECRIASISKRGKGLSLLLYKDARVDQNILDETVGIENWQRDHKELKGNIYCGISIWDETKKMWITKWDAGKESNAESEKGEASDSFKRAGFNWGIGRELYTAPFIWIPSSVCSIEENKCSDKFKLESIKIENKQITELKIINTTRGVECFNWKINREKKEYIEDPQLTTEEAKKLYDFLKSKGIDDDAITSTLQKSYGVSTLNELKKSQQAQILRNLNK